VVARTYAQALLPAISAGLSGGVAVLAGAGDLESVAIAALAAMAAGLVLLPDEAPSIRRRNAASAEPSAAASPPPAPQPAILQPAAVREIIEALPFGIMIVGPDRAIVRANARAAEVFSVREIEGQPVATLRARRLLDRIDTALVDRSPGTLDFTLSRGGDAFLKAHIRPLQGGSVLVALEDETKARRAGDLYRDFVANASHELKTPLAAISGIIETLLGHAKDDPGATARFLELLSTQTVRMTRLVEDLLSLNRIELNERVAPDQPQDLITIVGETVDALRPIAEAEGVELAADLPAQAPKVLGDRDELSQAIANLIDNAIKYGGEGTRVDVRAAEPKPELRGMIGVEVIDQGPGIAREHIPRLTERFYRVNIRRSREKGGTGLGLAIVKHIVSRHRGRLEIESTLGQGSCFRLWFPVSESDHRRSDVAEGPRRIASAVAR